MLGRFTTLVRTQMQHTRGIQHRAEWLLPNGMRLRGSVAGHWDRRPVILLHGGGQTRHSWQETAEALVSVGYRVYSVDLRGHGESDWDSNGGYDIPDFAEDVRFLCSSFRQPVAIVGQSLGGYSALLAHLDEPLPNTPIFAGNHSAQGTFSAARILSPPAKTAALVLVDIAPDVEMNGVERILRFMQSSPDGFRTLEEAHALVAKFRSHTGDSNGNEKTPSGKAKSASSALGLRRNLRPHPKDPSRLVWHWDPVMVRLWAEHFMKSLGQEGPVRVAALKAAQGLTEPVLLVRGARSDVLSSDGAQAFASAVPHAETADVSRATHAVVSEQNDAFASVVLRFLTRHYSP